MGLRTLKFKAGKLANSIKSQSRNKPINDLDSSKISKGDDERQNIFSEKTRKRYFSGEVRKKQRFHSKRPLKTAKTVRNVHDSVFKRVEREATSSAAKHYVTPLESKATRTTTKQHSLKLEKVEACVSAMLKFHSRNSKSKDHLLFEDDGQPIHMIVQCVRVPLMKTKNYRFCLPNPLVDESSEVCLFVPNLKKGKSEDHEPTIEHYREILEKHEVKGISQIVPLRQINVEFDQYELRRRLVSRFDMFLADGRITGHVQGLIGKEIHKRRKLPVPVDLRAKDLKKEINTALSKTLLMMNGHGDKASLKVAHTKQSVSQIAENIIAVSEGLAQHYPGGWANIRSLKIHLQDGVPVPVYMSLKNSNDVDIPIVTPNLPKKAVPVEGEVSTMPGVRVTVLPDGEIIIKKRKLTKHDREMGLSDSDLEEFDPDEEMDVNSSDEETKPADQVKVDPLPKTEEKEDDNADSDVSSVGGDDHVVEAAENAYLNQWREQWNENIEENTRKRKEKTVEDAVKDTPQTKKPKFIKDKTKKVKRKETENKNSKNVDPPSAKESNKKNVESANVNSPLSTSSKKLKMKKQKTAIKTKSSETTARKQKFTKKLISLKKKKNIAD